MALQATSAFQNDSLLSLRNRIPTWNSVKFDIKAAIRDQYGLDDASVIHISKRNKKLESGDFLVIIPSMKSKCSVQSQTLRNRNQLLRFCDSSACGDEVKATAAVETPMPCEVGTGIDFTFSHLGMMPSSFISAGQRFQPHSHTDIE